MTPIDQTKFHAPGYDPIRGNCQQAAVASLLDLALDDVPNFAEERYFWGSYHEFLRGRGLTDFDIPISRVPPPRVHYLAYGPASRGVRHAVVMLEGSLAHDPHFSREGLLEVEEQHVIIPTPIVPRWEFWRATGQFYRLKDGMAAQIGCRPMEDLI